MADPLKGLRAAWQVSAHNQLSAALKLGERDGSSIVSVPLKLPEIRVLLSVLDDAKHKGKTDGQ